MKSKIKIGKKSYNVELDRWTINPEEENFAGVGSVEIRKQRELVYGPPASAALVAEATGNAIRAILSAHWQLSCPEIPPHVVHLIMVQIKAVRAALPFNFNKDNYDDAHNYLDTAQKLDVRAEANSNDRVLERVRKDRPRGANKARPLGIRRRAGGTGS